MKIEHLKLWGDQNICNFEMKLDLIILTYLSWSMADGDILSIPNPDGCCAKLALLWITNKPLAILLLVLAALIQLGIIFLIVWFLILHKGSGS